MHKLQHGALDDRPKGVFITGTDTGVGKTLLAAALVTYYNNHTVNIGVMKPIETGITSSTKMVSDGLRLHQAANSSDAIGDVCPYIFKQPVAPYSAAGAQGNPVRITNILKRFNRLCQKHTFMLVEGVGGVYVPIAKSLTVLDLIEQLQLPVIVVGRSGLGGVNHALLTLDALGKRKISIIALVLNQLEPVLSKTARLQERSTVTLLRHLVKIPVVGPLQFSPQVQESWAQGILELGLTPEIKQLAKLSLVFARATA